MYEGTNGLFSLPLKEVTGLPIHRLLAFFFRLLLSTKDAAFAHKEELPRFPGALHADHQSRTHVERPLPPCGLMHDVCSRYRVAHTKYNIIICIF